MSIAEWTELSAVMDRISSLKSHAQAAAAAGDFATAAHFFGLVKRAEAERERTLERIHTMSTLPDIDIWRAAIAADQPSGC